MEEYGRTYNPYTYDNETDNYFQNHYQLLWNETISEKWSSNVAFNYTKGKKLLDGLVPAKMIFTPGGNTVVQFDGGAEAHTSCLRCSDAPCLFLAEEETLVSHFPDFPADRSIETCAAGAMSFDEEKGTPKIDPALCILCGLCVSRCPVGAIRLMPGVGAVVEDAPNEAFVETGKFSDEYIQEITGVFCELSRDGVYLEESDGVINDLVSRVKKAVRRQNDNFPNILVRNLFMMQVLLNCVRLHWDINSLIPY